MAFGDLILPPLLSERADVYENYKPLRNYLRSFGLWSGLRTTYHYMLYLQFGARLPQQLLTQKLQMGASNLAAGLHGHLVELLLRELILNAAQHGGRGFDTAPVAFRAMNMIHKVDGGSWGAHESRSGDIMLQLSRIAFKQFPWQDPPTNGSLARYYALYGHPAVAPMLETEFGMTPTELFQMVLLLIEELQHAPTLPLVFLGEAEGSFEDPIRALFGRLSNSASGLRKLIGETQSYDVNWGFGVNPVRQYPLIHAGDVRKVMCPAPPMLLQRLTDGLYYDLIRADPRFGGAIGKAFEDHVGNVAARIGRGRFEIRAEQCWGKPERRSVDWIISDPSASLFVECKLGRLDLASQTEIADPPPFVAAIERLSRAVGQVYATLTDALAGAYPHWRDDGRPIFPLIATFHEWFVFGPFFYAHLDKLVQKEFARRGLDHALCERYPFTICSIAEFDGMLAACHDHSIGTVMSAKLGREHRQWLMRGFLAERYPGSLTKAAAMFQKGMDPVIHGRTRLTGGQ
jgi:hypothetical protein